MDNVKFGIVGLGNMGQGHITNFIAGGINNASITAVCDIKQDKLDWAKEALGEGVALYDNAEEMFSSADIDAVLIATPHYLHPPMAISALNHNLHILVEKPAGVHTKQVKEMNEAAQKSEKVFGIMFNQRTNPLYLKARDLVSTGELGEIKRTIWIITDWYRTQNYYDSGGWRATWAGEGGGVLMNQSPHKGIINDFVNSILTGSPLLASGSEGINGVTLANAMYLSSWTDDWVNLPIDNELFYEKLTEKIESFK